MCGSNFLGGNSCSWVLILIIVLLLINNGDDCGCRSNRSGCNDCGCCD
ncbi:hypothetical protein [Solibaculum mannosilyticum]|uniref:Uncharacterized protein n=1 Tax=Solibaculum mannosilyticum TaxID=2780922 RepID=A0A7I8CYA5_9FIRM|nr:hypothetical protein [Solibaculum mannosilyticum]BCI59460.1 hypothetical protein C12CBH8_00990 [Solibaculum mannosilyticum]CZT55241.1 hypothetical protein BN3661_00312 [Eubacteriaceae bacterium CHKCI005]